MRPWTSRPYPAPEGNGPRGRLAGTLTLHLRPRKKLCDRIRVIGEGAIVAMGTAPGMTARIQRYLEDVILQLGPAMNALVGI